MTRGPAPIEFRVLGPVAVADASGNGVPVGGRDAAVLAALCLVPNEVTSAERLIDLVWGAARPANPANALQARISVLRRLIGRQRIETRPPGYVLHVGRDELDWTRLQDLVGRAGERAHHDPATAEAWCAEALGLWRGAPLSGLDDPSVDGVVAGWIELRRRAVVLRGECLVELGRAGEAVAVATTAFEDDQLDESVALLAIRALAASGRHAEALRVGQRHRRALAEAGLTVGAALAEVERIVAGGTGRLGRVPPPYYGDRCVGRAPDIAHLEDVLDRDRLISLVGPGGVGKTRLAREVALGRLSWWCDLGGLQPGGDVCSAVRAGLRIPTLPGRPAGEALHHALHDQSGVLVLDNCDDVATEVSQLVRTLLAECPELAIVATSRTALGVAGETVVEVAPLPCGPDAAAVDLLLDRAQDSGALTDADRDVASRIVTQVDGLPLAIELAAARLAYVGPRELAASLEDELDGLAAPAPARPQRHRSLASVVDGSWARLTPAARKVAAELAVFRDWFTVADAARVTTPGAPDPVAVVDELRRTSLLQADGRRQPPRFRFLTTVRRFAWDRIEGDAARHAVRTRHAAWAAELLADACLGVGGPGEADALAAAARLEPDVHAALGFAEPETATRLLAALAELGAMRLTAEDAQRFERAADGGVDDPWVLAGAAQAALVAGRLDRAAGWAARSSQSAHAGDAAVPWLARWVEGAIPMFRGDPEAARQRYEAARSESAGDAWQATFFTAQAAFAAANADHPDAALEAQRATLAAEALGNPSSIAWAQCALGASLTDSDPEAALAAFERAVSAASTVANQIVAGIARPRAAMLRARTGAAVGPTLGRQLAEWQRRSNTSHTAELLAMSIPILGAAGEHQSVAAVVGVTAALPGFALALPAERRSIARSVELARAALGQGRFELVAADAAAHGLAAVIDATRDALQRCA